MMNKKKSNEQNLKRAEKIIRKRLGSLLSDFELEAVGRGASTRAYIRILMANVPVNATQILLMEEKPFSLEKNDFYTVNQLFRRINLPVPQIYEEYSGDGAFLLQDLGDTHLYNLVSELPDDPGAWTALYEEAIDYLVTLQQRAVHYRKGVAAFDRAFDEKKLTWELEFALKHYAGGFCGYKPTREEKRVLGRFFADLSSRIAALPRVLCHRDYHSQNLILWMERLHIIDFQDARMGPHVYDLVSLLGDSYVELPKDFRDRMLAYYIEHHPAFDAGDLDRLRAEWYLIALQRHIKHLGTFGFQAESGNNYFVQFIPRTIGYVRENFAQHPEYSEAAAIIEAIFSAGEKRLLEADPA